MKVVAFDTSVLVAAVVAGHAHHPRALPWLDSGNRLDRRASWHAIAETWATLTRLPLDPPISAESAGEIVERLESLLRLRALTASIYREARRRCVTRSLRSGAIFDALHLVAARENGADAIATFNVKDFERLWERGDPEIVAPLDPPGLPRGW
jgi:predicted nucleic acid-binding protein